MMRWRKTFWADNSAVGLGSGMDNLFTNILWKLY